MRVAPQRRNRAARIAIMPQQLDPRHPAGMPAGCRRSGLRRCASGDTVVANRQTEKTMSDAQRTAIVTGAAGGIGRAVVKGLLGAGVRVAAVDRTRDGLATVASS